MRLSIALAMAGFGSFSGFSAGAGSAWGLAGSVFSLAGTVSLEAAFSGVPPFSGSDDGCVLPQPANGRRASRKRAWKDRRLHNEPFSSTKEKNPMASGDRSGVGVRRNSII